MSASQAAKIKEQFKTIQELRLITRKHKDKEANSTLIVDKTLKALRANGVPSPIAESLPDAVVAVVTRMRDMVRELSVNARAFTLIREELGLGPCDSETLIEVIKATRALAIGNAVDASAIPHIVGDSIANDDIIPVVEGVVGRREPPELITGTLTEPSQGGVPQTQYNSYNG